MNKFLLKIKNRSSYIKKNKSINPHRSWLVLIKIAITLFTIVILLGLYLLYKIKNEKIFQINPIDKSTPIIIKEDLLSEFDKTLKNKENKTFEIKTGEVIFIDPSI